MGRGGREIADLDDECVRRALEGDGEAFRRIVHTYGSLIYRLAYGVVQHPKDAEDAAQEAFARIYASLSHYRGPSLKAWMSRIAVNCAIDCKRKAARRREELTDTEPDSIAGYAESGSGAEGTVLRKEFRRHVWSRVEELPDKYRHVIVAYYVEEKSYEEIAGELGVKVKTVESQLYRARQWLRENWKEDAGYDSL